MNNKIAELIINDHFKVSMTSFFLETGSDFAGGFLPSPCWETIYIFMLDERNIKDSEVSTSLIKYVTEYLI